MGLGSGTFSATLPLDSVFMPVAIFCLLRTSPTLWHTAQFNYVVISEYALALNTTGASSHLEAADHLRQTGFRPVSGSSLPSLALRLYYLILTYISPSVVDFVYLFGIESKSNATRITSSTP
jgi:hypothetical protein